MNYEETNTWDIDCKFIFVWSEEKQDFIAYEKENKKTL